MQRSRHLFRPSMMRGNWFGAGRGIFAAIVGVLVIGCTAAPNGDGTPTSRGRLSATPASSAQSARATTGSQFFGAIRAASAAANPPDVRSGSIIACGGVPRLRYVSPTGLQMKVTTRGPGTAAEYTISALALDEETTRPLVVQAQLLLVKAGTVASTFSDTVRPGAVVAAAPPQNVTVSEPISLKIAAYSEIETIRSPQFYNCENRANSLTPGQYQLYAQLFAENPQSPDVETSPVVVDSVLWGPSNVTIP